MPSRELRRAYPALKREWSPQWGRVRRLDGIRGIPDFLLTLHKRPGIAIFAEVKAVEHEGAPLGLMATQAHRLADLDSCGLIACVIAHVDEKNWVCWRGPFLTPDLRVADAWNSGGIRHGKVLTPWLIGE